jgi:hypothetical protein
MPATPIVEGAGAEFFLMVGNTGGGTLCSIGQCSGEQRLIAMPK